MTLECRSVLPNGRKCRAAATRNQAFCRHHGPKSAVDGPPPIAKRQRFTTLARWRALGRNLRWLDPAEIPLAVFEILDSLTGANPDERLSDLAAGRYLRTLLVRLGEVPFPAPELAPPAPAPHPSALGAPAAPPSSPLSPEIRAALAAFPPPGQKIGNHDLDPLIAAFVKSGFVPPDMLPRDMRPSRS